MRTWLWMSVGVMAGCAGETGDSGDSDGDTDVVDTSTACTELTSGRWEGSGAAFGMAMGVDLTMDAESCSFTLTNWSMDMGPIADAGAVDGDEVTLSGPDDYWATCVGTAESVTLVSGVCSDDGAAFELAFDE